MILGFLDFNSFYGEVAPNDWFTKLLPIGFGTLLGFGLTKYSNWYSKNQSIKNAGMDLQNELQLLKSPIEKQITSLKKLAGDLKILQLTSNDLELNFLLNTKRIDLIDRNSVMEYYVKINKGDRKKAREILNNIYVQLDILTFEISRTQNLWEDYIERSTVYFENWKVNLDSIIKYCADCWSDNERKGIENDNFLNEFFQLTNSNANQEIIADIFIMREKYHKPLAELGAKYRIDTRVTQLRDLNYQCFQAISSLENLRNERSKKFTRIETSLNTILGKIIDDKLLLI